MLMNRTVDASTSQGPRRHNADAVSTGPHSFVVADGIGDSADAAVAARATADAAARAVVDPIGAARTALGEHGDAVLVVATRDGAGFSITWAGDARAYHWDGARLTQLTTDQTVAEFYRSRGVKPNPRMEHVVMNSVRHSTPDNTGRVVVGPGRLLLTSDGVHGVLAPAEMAAILTGDDAAARLVRAALHAGGSDNATALVVDSLA